MENLRHDILVSTLLAGFETLPETSAAQLLNGRRAMVIAPHPDDESLGCGGLIAAASEMGLAPIVVMVTDGTASHPGSRDYPPTRLRDVRFAELRAALRILGLPPENLSLLNIPDGEVPHTGPGFTQAVSRLRETATASGCALIIGPWSGDGHPDHQAAAKMSGAAAKAMALPLLSYPVWGWLRDPAERLYEPRTGGFRLNIADHLAQKRAAVAAHRSQYGGLIHDSPDGFMLPQDLLSACLRDFEVFIE